MSDLMDDNSRALTLTRATSQVTIIFDPHNRELGLSKGQANALMQLKHRSGGILNVAFEKQKIQEHFTGITGRVSGSQSMINGSKNWCGFKTRLEQNIRNIFEKEAVLRNISSFAFDVASEINKQYLEQVPNWISKGNEKETNISGWLRGNLSVQNLFYDIQIFYSFNITEKCENNWFQSDFYHVSFNGNVDVNGYHINKTKILRIAVVAENDIENLVQMLNKKYGTAENLSLDDI
eukprot:TRINITY_DN3403_c0_g1_i1.p1 TRINITY_DN3403_c0_g1~~TRINITY_DN3403_c0_g1_i1.p1  ORF type:complete len:243 (+),score=31.96 TRINITY_DN3403_c0_g1_i1:24-731(+)